MVVVVVDDVVVVSGGAVVGTVGGGSVVGGTVATVVVERGRAVVVVRRVVSVASVVVVGGSVEVVVDSVVVVDAVGMGSFTAMSGSLLPPPVPAARAKPPSSTMASPAPIAPTMSRGSVESANPPLDFSGSSRSPASSSRRVSRPPSAADRAPKGSVSLVVSARNSWSASSGSCPTPCMGPGMS